MTFGHSAVIGGPTSFKAADLEIPDLRAGFVYVIAALMAQGTSRISGIEHLDRGYESLAEKLSALGAQIHVEEDSPEDKHFEKDFTPPPFPDELIPAE
jgi:UDP-N-acetylglucosamine 1-carboxyvinyltransferase